MKEAVQTITLRVVIFKDGALWVAQCLEHDIGAQAPDLDTLHDRFTVAVMSELRESLARHSAPLAGIDPAPKRFHQMWERRSRSLVSDTPAWMINDMNVSLGLVA